MFAYLAYGHVSIPEVEFLSLLHIWEDIGRYLVKLVSIPEVEFLSLLLRGLHC